MRTKTFFFWESTKATFQPVRIGLTNEQLQILLQTTSGVKLRSELAPLLSAQLFPRARLLHIVQRIYVRSDLTNSVAAISPQLSSSSGGQTAFTSHSDFETSLAVDVWKAADPRLTRWRTTRVSMCVSRFTPWTTKADSQEFLLRVSTTRRSLHLPTPRIGWVQHRNQAVEGVVIWAVSVRKGKQLWADLHGVTWLITYQTVAVFPGGVLLPKTKVHYFISWRINFSLRQPAKNTWFSDWQRGWGWEWFVQVPANFYSAYGP